MVNTSAGPEEAWRLPRALLLILLAGLVLRVVILVGASGVGARIVDEQQYLTLSRSLADGRGFATESGPTSLRPPLYPAFVAAVWTVTGLRTLAIVRGVQLVLALLTTYAVFRLGRMLFDERTGLFAAAIVCFYPPLLFANVLLLTETLFTLLVVLMLLAYQRVLASGSAAAAFATGALIGLGALTRSVLWPFVFVLVPFTLVAVRRSWLQRAGLAVLLVAGWGLVLAPWAIRNSRLWGMPVLVDTMGGMNLRMGNYEYTPHDRIWDAVAMHGEKSWIVGLPPHPPGGGMWTEAQKERWARDEAVSYMASHPVLTLWRNVIKLGDFWALDRDFAAGISRGLYHPSPWFAALGIAAMLVAYPVVVLLAVLGATAKPPVDLRAHILLLLTVAFVCALHVIVFAHPRYRLPIMPLLALYAGSAIAGRCWQPGRRPQRLMPLAVSAAALLVATWTVQFVWRDWSFAQSAIRLMVSG
jgi:4-amino-4-deoxy-L-arabinose transferase-like glycosyltransferase